MKKIIFSGLLAAMFGTGAYFASQKHQRADLSEIQLANIEAISACEVSSNPRHNYGYCVKLLNTDIDVCVNDGNALLNPRCCGNI